MSGEALTKGTDYFKPFPDAKHVFSRDVEQHAEFLLPAATLRLNHICPDWGGDIDDHRLVVTDRRPIRVQA